MENEAKMSMEARIAALEQGLKEVADRDAVRELTARYCWHVQQGQPEEIVNLFTADGVFDGSQSGIGIWRGTAELLKFYRESICPAGVALPFIQNHVVEVRGDEARATCALEGRFSRAGRSITGAGYYHDRYRREQGSWRFAERKFVAFHMVTLEQGWAKKAE